MEATKEQVMEEVLKVDAHATGEVDAQGYLVITTFLPDEVGEHLLQEFDSVWEIKQSSVVVMIVQP